MIRSLTLMLLMTPLALHAQRTSPAVSTHILTFAPTGLPEAFQTYYQTAGNIELFTATVGTLGLPTPYTGPQDFALYASEDDAKSAAKRKSANPPVATVTLPEKCDLVLLVCNRSDDDKVNLTASNLDSKDLKPGDYRVFNFSKIAVSMNMGDQTLTLEPGKDSVVRDSNWHKETLSMPLKIATVTDGKSRSVYSSFREHSPQDRTLMFLFDGSHPSRPITFATFNAEAAAGGPASGKGSSKRR